MRRFSNINNSKFYTSEELVAFCHHVNPPFSVNRVAFYRKTPISPVSAFLDGKPKTIGSDPLPRCVVIIRPAVENFCGKFRGRKNSAVDIHRRVFCALKRLRRSPKKTMPRHRFGLDGSPISVRATEWYTPI